MEHRYLVAVHAGAGYHSTKLEGPYRAGLAGACQAAAQALAAGGTPLDAVGAALVVLEDCEVCNAGRGSNLTFGGVVECDASVMGGDGSFGAVGAVPGVANPSKAAHRMAQELSQPMSNGRVRPMMLVGDPARVWALSRGIPAAQSQQEAAECNVTEAARRRWKKYRCIVDSSLGKDEGPVPSSATGSAAAAVAAAGAGKVCPPAAGAVAAAAAGGEGGAAGEAEEQPGCRPAKRTRLAAPAHPQPQRPQQAGQQLGSGGVTGGSGSGGREEEGGDDEDSSLHYDTVGVVVVDGKGRVAAGVSSGGIALKSEGRVGEAAVFGAGCWAQDATGGSRPAVACSVTGVGERVMQHLVARECALRVSTSASAGAACREPVAATTATTAAAGAPTAGGEEDVSTISEACAAVLRQTVLQGPPPRDCGVLCIRAAVSGPQASPSTADGDGDVERAAPQEPAGSVSGSTAPAPPSAAVGAVLGTGGVAVELGVAHSSQSMAVGYLTHAMAQPRVTFLRQAGRGGSALKEGQGQGDLKTLTFGVHWDAERLL